MSQRLYLWQKRFLMFIERKNYKVLLAGYEKWKAIIILPDVGCYSVDHCVGNVGWTEWSDNGMVRKVMGFVNNFRLMINKSIHRIFCIDVQSTSTETVC